MSEMRVPFYFAPDPGDPDAGVGYLRYLSDCLYYAVWRCDRDTAATANWWAKFRRFTDEMGISNVECPGITFGMEVRSVLSSQNPGAVAWARALVDGGLAVDVDCDDPGSVIALLYWPAGSKPAVAAD